MLWCEETSRDQRRRYGVVWCVVLCWEVCGVVQCSTVCVVSPDITMLWSPPFIVAPLPFPTSFPNCSPNCISPILTFSAAIAAVVYTCNLIQYHWALSCHGISCHLRHTKPCKPIWWRIIIQYNGIEHRFMNSYPIKLNQIMPSSSSSWVLLTLAATPHQLWTTLREDKEQGLRSRLFSYMREGQRLLLCFHCNRFVSRSEHVFFWEQRTLKSEQRCNNILLIWWWWVIIHRAANY